MRRQPLSTKLCDMLNIEYPILLAGMGAEATPMLVAAVSNAGGLGVLGRNASRRDFIGTGSAPDPKHLRYLIRETKKLTSKPFGVDLLIPADAFKVPSTAEAKSKLPPQHVAFVQRLRAELGIADIVAPDPEPLTMGRFHELMEVLYDEKVPVFVSGLGNPSFVVPEAHAHGMKVLALVGNVRQANAVAAGGVDAVIAQGYDAGGHTGKIGTFALVPQIVDAVRPTPVVAAGGIGDGRGLAAALSLGAIGVWCGTVFLTALESELPDFIIERLLSAHSEDAQITRMYTGKTCRWLKNKLTERWEKEGLEPLPLPYQGILMKDIAAGLVKKDLREYLGSPAGQVLGLNRARKSVNQIIEDMVEDALRVFKEYAPA